MFSNLYNTARSVHYRDGHAYVEGGDWTSVSAQAVICDLLRLQPLVKLTFYFCRFRDVPQLQQIVCALPDLCELRVESLPARPGGHALPLSPSMHLARLAIDFRDQRWPKEASNWLKQSSALKTITHLEVTAPSLDDTPVDFIDAFGPSLRHLVLRYCSSRAPGIFEEGNDDVGLGLPRYLFNCANLSALTFVCLPSLCAAQLQSLIASVPPAVHLHELNFDIRPYNPEELDWQAIGATLSRPHLQDLRAIDIQLSAMSEWRETFYLENLEVRAHLASAIGRVHHARATIKVTCADPAVRRLDSYCLPYPASHRFTLIKEPFQEVVTRYEMDLPQEPHV